MATSTQLPVEEYLRMNFDGPDREYLDGEVVERTVGGNKHSKTQVEFIRAIDRKTAALHVRSELRMQTAPNRFRIADVAVFSVEPAAEVPSTPPLIVIEIVSRDDRHTEIVEKLAEYRRWGVRCVWLADPYNHMLHIYDEDGLRQVPSLDLAEYNLSIRHEDLF